jgi:hypothetical protein
MRSNLGRVHPHKLAVLVENEKQAFYVRDLFSNALPIAANS